LDPVVFLSCCSLADSEPRGIPGHDKPDWWRQGQAIYPQNNGNRASRLNSIRKIPASSGGVLNSRGQRNLAVQFQRVSAVVMKCYIFWNITPRSPLKIKLRNGAIFRLHLQGQRISQAKKEQHETGGKIC
jgi:hypothetical protein